MRLERGGIRKLLLVSLLAGPAHGYELIRRFDESSGGSWSPSPGSVYPTLQLLVDEGLLTCSSTDDKKVYSLTPAGTAAAQAADTSSKPWDQADLSSGTRLPLRDITHAVHAAARQVGAEGRPEQIAKAVEIMRATRQQLYLLLAED